jgi:UDP-3-O-[3-hydroxymyristoyl] glucosamine N-acyltransferase
MRKSLREIAESVGGVVEGDETVIIEGVGGIKDAEPGQITFLANPKYLPMLKTTRASGIIVGREAPSCGKNLIRTDNPYLAFTQTLKIFAPEPPRPKGIHPGAIIGKDVLLGKDVALHAGVVLEDGCSVGEGSVLYPGVFVGSGAGIGSDCTIYPRVIIFHNVLVGDRVIMHSGAVIGGRPRPGPASDPKDADGQGGGTAIIEDDVEVGAGVTIDCAREGTTIIGHGTKIDNLVHIGADTSVGCNCLIVSQALVGSRCKMGEGVTMAGQAGMIDGITVGDGTTIAARAGLIEDVGAKQTVSGFPAYSHAKWLRTMSSIKRLPSMVRDIREFKKRLGAMEDIENDKPENH